MQETIDAAGAEQRRDRAFLFAPAFTIGAPVLFGQLLRNRIRLNQALRERARRDERAEATTRRLSYFFAACSPWS